MRMSTFIFLLLLVVCAPGIVSGANILFFFGVSTYSHRITVWPLVESLLEKGHNVTFISPYQPKIPDPRVSEFCPKSVIEFTKNEEIIPNALKIRSEIPSIAFTWFVLPDYSFMMCSMILKDPETFEWVQKSSFDLVVIDSLMNDCGLGLAYKFKAPHILFGTSSMFPWMYETYGVPVESSWIPDTQYHYPQDMTFLQSVHTTLNPFMWSAIKSWYLFPQLEQLMKETLRMPDMPSLGEIERNASLVFINTHFSDEYARSLPPFIVPIGGIHVKSSTKAVPKNMEDFILKSSKGFVLVSFGSSVSISKGPVAIQKRLINTLKRFNDIQFIFKWDEQIPEDPPGNVMFSEWLPQQDLLAHPKLLAFVTHGGELSIQEAAQYGVPLVTFPCFAEQDYNAERVHRMEIGISLEITTVTEDQFEDALNKVLTDSRYRKNMKRVSELFRDRPMSPQETALWWTEYVLRHKHIPSIKPMSMEQSWWKRRVLHVWFSLFSIFLIMIYVTTKVVCKFLSCLLCKKPSTGGSKKSKMEKGKKLKTK